MRLDRRPDDVKNKSLEEKQLEPDTLTGSRINEATLGTVVKYREDAARVRAHGVGRIVADAVAHGV